MPISTDLLSAFRAARTTRMPAYKALAVVRAFPLKPASYVRPSIWAKPHGPATRQPSNPELYYVENINGLARLAVENAGQEMNGRRQHNGWYCQPYQEVMKDGSGLVWGVVVQLPHGRFYPGYAYGGQDGYTINFSERYDSKEDALYPADSMAERAAEKELEYQTAWQAGSMFAGLKEERDELGRELDQLKATQRALPKAARATVAKAIARVVAEREALQDQMNELASGGHDGLGFYLSAELQAAFNEGANL